MKYKNQFEAINIEMNQIKEFALRNEVEIIEIHMVGIYVDVVYMDKKGVKFEIKTTQGGFSSINSNKAI